uniref:Tumor necrosis factor receptor superfamily member 5 n=1 Tax=Jaculus jaculus TaxID=51337 RepID=A0A8C5P2X0_JACJA
MVRVSLPCVLWGCLLAVHPEPPTACSENQYLVNNQCCDKCPPGKKLVKDCTELTETQCTPCGKGEFLDTWNSLTRCHQHQYCEPHSGLQVLKEGTSETDTTCTCQEGQHCTSNDCERCAPHTSCGPGFGVKQMATGSSDTVCELCPTGFFSNVSSYGAALGMGFEYPWVGLHRMRDLVAIPIVMGLLIAIAVLLSVYIRKVSKKSKDKVLQLEVMRHHPVEVDFPGHNPAAPVQETLQGCQPVTQEDGKESRISVQERL